MKSAGNENTVNSISLMLQTEPVKRSSKLLKAFDSFLDQYYGQVFPKLDAYGEQCALEEKVAHFYYLLGKRISSIIVKDSPEASIHEAEALLKCQRKKNQQLPGRIRKEIHKAKETVKQSVNEKDIYIELMEHYWTRQEENPVLNAQMGFSHDFETRLWSWDGPNILSLDRFLYATESEYLVEAFLEFKDRKEPFFQVFNQLRSMTPFMTQVGTTVFLSRAPTTIYVNPLGNLHHTELPAVEYANGDCYHFINGVFVEKRLFEASGEDAASDILGIRNLEVRRVLIERIGIDRFLELNKAELCSVDDYGSLYNIKQNDVPSFLEIEPDCFVKLLNSTPEPGTEDVFKEYLLQVPPSMKTPREAVAWSFGLEEEEYAPLKQS